MKYSNGIIVYRPTDKQQMKEQLLMNEIEKCKTRISLEQMRIDSLEIQLKNLTK